MSQVNRARIKRLVISPSVFFHVLQENTTWKVERGIPTGAKLRGMTLDPNTQNLNLFIEDQSFEEISLDSEIAMKLDILLKKI